MIKNVLLATDGSEHAWAAWQYALDIARAYGAWLRALSVIDARALHEPVAMTTGGLYPSAVESTTSVEREQKMEAEQTQLLEEVKRKTEAAGVKAQISLVRGVPADTILSHEGLADVIALGHRGHRSVWDVFFLGSVAEEVVRRSAKPVLVAPQTYEPIQRMLVAYDGSDPAQRALHWAANLATTMTLPLDVVHVAHDHLTGQNVLREAHEYLRPYDAVPGVETILREGAAAEQILGAASERGAGLIVMGAHGHSRLYEVLLGSVTDGVLRNANRPLLMSK